jgi:uncharacterized RDD family membrane protein YckC
VQDFKQAQAHRIIGSAIYDGLVVMGLLMIAGFIAVLINKLLTGEESIGSNPAFQLYLVLVIVGYFLYFWNKSGQTVGMKAWRIKLINQETTTITNKQLLIRLMVAIPSFLLCGLGVLWQYIGKQKLNWQDIASNTRIVHMPKTKLKK